MSSMRWERKGDLANVNCLVSAFCLRAVNAVVLRVDSYCLTKQSEMDEAMWNRYAPIPNAMKSREQKDSQFSELLLSSSCNHGHSHLPTHLLYAGLTNPGMAFEVWKTNHP